MIWLQAAYTNDTQNLHSMLKQQHHASAVIEFDDKSNDHKRN